MGGGEMKQQREYGENENGWEREGDKGLSER